MGKRILDNLKNNKYNKVSFLLGAGASTAAGIPDFRSNDGIYKKIKDKYDLEDPSMIFNIHFFKQNPHIYYDYLHHRVNIDSKEPTKTHLFMKTFQDSNKLNLIYTQNIDCLEYKAGINTEFIVQCHGNYRKIVCSECNKEHSYEKFNEHREKKLVYYCDFCNTAPCKPAVTFFGEPLPQDFYNKKDDIVLSD